MAAAGYKVAGADTASALVKAALTHPHSAPAIVADAARLPFPDESADLVIAFMCLHDVDDMPAAVAEAARILTSGRFALALHHPFVTARFAGTYLAEQRYTLTVQDNGASMTYEGTHRQRQPAEPFLDLVARRQLPA